MQFMFVLAEKLHMTVKQLCDNCSSYEITQWTAYLKLKSAELEKERKREEQRAKVQGHHKQQQMFSIDDLPDQL